MKALTIWQPHASLLALGVRTIETRGWSTTYRGPLVIHAAKKWDAARIEQCEAADLLLPPGEPLASMKWIETLGCALGVADLVDCRPIPLPCGTQADRLFGEFGPGRFGLYFENARPFDNPLPCLGRQGRPWDWSEGIPW
jgi:hypothetical protein